MIRIYCDESHDDKEQDVMVYSTLNGREESWIAFEKIWNNKLFKYDLPYMHWSDCVQGAGRIFRRFTKEQRKEIQKDFLGLIRICPIHAFAVAVKIQDFISLKSEATRFFKIPSRSGVSGDPAQPFFFAFWSCLIFSTLELLKCIQPGETLAFCFDHRQEAGLPAYSAQQLQTSVPGRIVSHTFADKKQVVPLQAVDIIAYESFRFFKSSFLDQWKPRWQ